jgi:transcriptional regulator with XRE-family HTH domain
MPTMKELRAVKEWSQVDLAHELGVSPATVYSWERGTHDIPARLFRKMAGLFGVTMDEIELPELLPKPDLKAMRAAQKAEDEAVEAVMIQAYQTAREAATQYNR